MDTILARRSIRKYTDEPLSDEDLEALMRAAMAAPSASNQQPWYFVVIRDRERLAAIPSFHRYAAMMPDAAAAVMVCARTEGLRHPHHWRHDCSAAVQNILLEATSRGLGSVWLGVYPVEERVQGCRELAELPDDVTPFALVALGHPAEEKPPADRYDPSRVHHETW